MREESCGVTEPHPAHVWHEEEFPTLFSNRFTYDEYQCPGVPA